MNIQPKQTLMDLIQKRKEKTLKNTGMYYNIYILITVRQITEYFSVVLKYIE